MAPPRVLFSFSTRIGTGGIGTTAWHEVTGLAAQGADVHVATGSVERPLTGASVALESMRVAGRRVPYRLFGLERAASYHDWRTARFLAANPNRFDIVHAWPLGAERTLATARRLGLPGLLERPNAHTAFAYETVRAECARLGIAVDPSSPHAYSAATLAREQREYDAAGFLLCPSDFVARTHAERGIAPKRLLRHRYGYDPERFSPGPARPADRPFTAAFVGRVEPRKGLHFALEAWRAAGLAGSGRFVICGAVDPGYDQVLVPLLDQPGIEQHGHHPDPAAVMREADVLVLPSLEEGSALVTYEARGCGCVLVVSDHSGAVCDDGRDGLVHRAGDTTMLAEHLRRLAEDPALLARLRVSSVAGVGELTWSAAATALLGAYERAAQA